MDGDDDGDDDDENDDANDDDDDDDDEDDDRFYCCAVLCRVWFARPASSWHRRL